LTCRVALNPPVVHAGPDPCDALCYGQKEGKTQSGKEGTHERGVIRAKDVSMCPVGQVGRHMVVDLTLLNLACVDPRDPAFYLACMFHGSNPSTPMNPGTYGEDIKTLYRDGAGVDVPGLAAHGPRYFGTRLLDAMGLPEEVSEVDLDADVVYL